MGWADCGTDSKGRPIGYAHQATCDEPGCSEQIDRGLSYACGDMHGETAEGCENYFCEAHRQNPVQTADGRTILVCTTCAASLLESGEYREDDDEGLVRKDAAGV